MSDEHVYTSETTVVDLSSQIDSWLNATLALVTTHNLPTIATELRALNKWSKMPGFRITVVGEARRGKSTLINYIMDRRLLHKSHPTPATFTSIVAGQNEQMDIHFPDGKHEIRLVDYSSWDDLIIQTTSNDKAKVLFPQVFITLRHTWLQENDLELIDTPSLGTLNEHHTVLLSEILGKSDAVILVVNAAAALSLTEIAFLEQEVVGRHVPRIMVVVTKLDTISQEEQEAVLEKVREKVDRISPLIPVLSSAQLRLDTPDLEKIENIRAQIEKLAAKLERRALRSRQVAETLLDYLNQIIEVAHTAITAAHMDAAKREEALKVQEEERRQVQQHLHSIEQGLDKRRLLLDDALRKRLYATRDNLVATILLELSRTQDIKVWYERDLPLHLHREFFSIARAEEAYILGMVTDDMQWFRDKVAIALNVYVERSPRLRGIQTELESQLKDKKVADTERLRLLSRVGSRTAMIAYYMLFLNPIGAAIGGAISVAAELISDLTINRKAEVQREELRQEVVRSIEQAIDEYTRRLSGHLLAIYKEMAQNILQAQSTLQIEKVAILKESTTSSNERSWQQLIDQVSVLEQKVLTALMQKGSNTHD